MTLRTLLLLLLMAQRSAWSAEAIAFPDPILTDQTGKPVRFYTDLIKGNTVVIDFVFTSCTIVCRPLTANLRKVQADLGEDASKVQFISVSVDPDHDTPAALNAFAEIFHTLPGWRFLTGKKADIDRILKACGVYTIEPNYHTARVFIGSDAAGWSRLYGLSPHSTLAQAVRRVMLCGVNGKETTRE
jgi:protein SCO1/2